VHSRGLVTREQARHALPPFAHSFRCMWRCKSRTTRLVGVNARTPPVIASTRCKARPFRTNTRHPHTPGSC